MTNKKDVNDMFAICSTFKVSCDRVEQFTNFILG